MADDVRVEMVRQGSKMELWLGDVHLATVDPGIPAQQLARYVEMQVRAGFPPASIQAMLRGESKATTGSTAPPRKSAPTETKKAGPAKAPSAPAVDLEEVLSGTVAHVKKALASGDLDAHLPALERLETGGKARKGVLEAIAARSSA